MPRTPSRPRPRSIVSVSRNRTRDACPALHTMAGPLLVPCAAVAWLGMVLSLLLRFARRGTKRSVPTWTLPLHTLPRELQWRVLLHVARPSPMRLAPHDSLGRVLCLSRATLHALQAPAYRDVYIHSAEALHGLRRTLVRDAPHLGQHIRSLHLSSCGATSPIALEQLFLAVPHLTWLSIDAATLWRLCESQAGRLAHAARPKEVHLHWQVHPDTWSRLPNCLAFRLWEDVHTLTITSHVACAPLVASAPSWPHLARVHWHAVPRSDHDTSWRIACAHATRLWEARGVQVVWEGIQAPT